MKTKLLIVMAIALALFTSCQKEDDVVPSTQSTNQSITYSIPAPELLGTWKIINSTSENTIQFLYPGGNNLFLIETIVMGSPSSAFYIHYYVTDITDSTLIIQKSTPELLHYSVDGNFLTIEGVLVYVKMAN